MSDATHTTGTDPGEAALRLQLRGLRRDLPPGRDLWPGIADRLAAGAPVPAPRRTRSPRRWAPLALAASLLLAVGVAWHLQPPPAAPAGGGGGRLAGSGAGPDPSDALIPREARAMSLEYRAALDEMRVAGGRPRADGHAAEALRELDRSALQIRDALARDPGASFLLERLRRTYEQRLALTQRVNLS